MTVSQTDMGHYSAMDHLPGDLYTAEQTRLLDQCAIKHEDTSAFDLMTRAGEAAFACLLDRWSELEHLVVLAGRGNNGGDGYVVAALAALHGIKVSLYQIGDHRQQSDAAHEAKSMALDAGIVPKRIESVLVNGRLTLPDLEGAANQTLIVDAVLGTGLDSLVRQQYADLIQAINDHPAEVLALDIPSGLHSDSGRILGCAVKATMTVTFIAVKQGLLAQAGPDLCGEICYASLNVAGEVYKQVPANLERISWHRLSRLNQLLPVRAGNAHKGHFGHVMVVGGYKGMGGAAAMATEAALRTGAGLVSCCTYPGHLSAILARTPEAMVQEVESGQALAPSLTKASVIALGPGLGQSGWSEQLLHQVLNSIEEQHQEAGRNPTHSTVQPASGLVLDADALNLLARPEWRRSFAGLNVVLTPHPGEAARLLDCRVEDVESNRFVSARQLAEAFQAVVVLKGRGSLIAAPNGQLALCSDGNPGMASGGMGDVLTGCIAALLAQGMPALEAARMGVCLHAAAADEESAQGRRGLLATDLMRGIRRLNN